MCRNVFSFEGGEKLTSMGACWFVSYFYYTQIDSNHLNWKNLSTVENRISIFSNTESYQKSWLYEVVNMNENNLEKNILGLSGSQVKYMAHEL